MKHSIFWKKQNVLITGGTSGLGRALAIDVQKRGASVAIVARRIPAEPVPGAHLILGDVSDKNQIHRIYAEALTALGSVDLLFNNASQLGATPLRLLIDTDCEDLAGVLETNLLGP